MLVLSSTLEEQLDEHLKELKKRKLGVMSIAAAQEGMQEPVLEAGEIQGNILPGFTMKYQLLIGLRIKDGHTASARQWLKDHVLKNLSTMERVFGFRQFRRESRSERTDADELPVVPINIAISMPGLQLLTTGAEEIKDESFKNGLYKASVRLGDPSRSDQPGHISTWKYGRSEDTVPHVLLIMASDSLDSLNAVSTEMKQMLLHENAAFENESSYYEDFGHQLPGGIEHFGFRDGISQPGVRGILPWGGFVTRRQISSDDSLSAEFAAPGKPLVWPGQFVFGYESHLPDRPLVPGTIRDDGPIWLKNGSFLVFRRLHQNVSVFRAFFTELADQLKDVPELKNIPPDNRSTWLQSRIVGRWPSGAPVMRSPEADDPAEASDSLALNHFQFKEATVGANVIDENGMVRTIAGCPADFLGDICPAFAHIRKVNPRDVDTDKASAEATRSFQMLRRGLPFGPLYDDDPNEDDRGLLFLSYQTMINKLVNSVHGQFELLSSDWMNTATAPQSGGFDLLVGQKGGRARNASLQLASGEYPINVTEQWVTPTGGGYFFAPSRSCLEKMLDENS